MIKSLNTLALDISESDYRAYPAFSYSGIATFFREGPKSLVEHAFKDSAALRNGSLLDTLLTEPEELENKFLIADMPVLSDKLRILTETIFNNFPSSENITDIKLKDLVAILDSMEYQTNWKAETRYNKITDECGQYFKLLSLGMNKKIISQEEYDKTRTAVDYLLSTHPFQGLLVNDPFNSNLEGLWQSKFTTMLDGIPVRCMFDRIIVDHITKKIYPIDIKTTGYDEESFETSYLKWNYYIQAKLYEDILKDLCQKDEYFKDFTINPFTFMVINVNNLNPILWVVPKTEELDRKLLMKGYTPYQELIKDMKWHFDNQVFDRSKETYINNSIRVIKLPFITLPSEV
jgi:hypothetical protein